MRDVLAVAERDAVFGAVDLEAAGGGNFGVAVADADSGDVGLPVDAVDDEALETQQVRVRARLEADAHVARGVGVVLGAH